MEDAVYKEHILRMYIVIRMLRDIPLEEMITSAERSMAIGPVFDPTLFKEKHQNMAEDILAMKSLMEAKMISTKVFGDREEMYSV